MDEDNDDGLGGRSRDRREVTLANRWSRPLCALTELQLQLAPLPDEVREAVALARMLQDSTTRAYRARDRQYQRIDKLIRSLPDEEIAAIDAWLAQPDEGSWLQSWVDRLVAEGDEALQAWMDEHPDADRQQLRTLARRVRKDPAARAALLEALKPQVG